MTVDRSRPSSARRWASALGANLAFAREASNRSQTELAEDAGTSRATIAQIESGGGDPRLSTLVAIAEALSVSPYVLLMEKNDFSKLLELMQTHGDITKQAKNDEDVELLKEMSTSNLDADRRRAAREAKQVASKYGFVGAGAIAGAAIGTIVCPGLGAVIGGLIGASNAKKGM